MVCVKCPRCRVERGSCERRDCIARTHLSTGYGEVVPGDWELFYGTTRKDYREQKLFKALFLKAIEPFETIYAQVHRATNWRWRRRCFGGVLRRKFGLTMELSSLN